MDFATENPGEGTPSRVGGAVCLCGAKWGVSPGIRGGSAGRYAAVGRILKRGGWVAGFDRCLECLCSQACTLFCCV